MVVGRRRYSWIKVADHQLRQRPRCLVPVPHFSPPTPPEVTDTAELSSLVVLLLNGRTVYNNTMPIRDLIVDDGADLAYITETWMAGPDITQLYSTSPRAGVCVWGVCVAIVHRNKSPLLENFLILGWAVLHTPSQGRQLVHNELFIDKSTHLQQLLTNTHF